jgi:hypothetical protein
VKVALRSWHHVSDGAELGLDLLRSVAFGGHS